MVSTQRKEELQAAIKNADDPSWPDIKFLDSINSVEEFDELLPLIKESVCRLSTDILVFYRATLSKWPDPKLEDWFKKDFPLVAARLDTPQKIRTFLRAANFRNVSVATMASVFEDILRKHEVEGQQVVRYERYRGNSWCDALRIVYHTQIQAFSVTEVLLPGCKCCGTSTRYGLYVDWRSKEERKAAGEPY